MDEKKPTTAEPTCSCVQDPFADLPRTSHQWMLIWGLPPLFLARWRGLESAAAFHWFQDVARFLAGF